MTPRAICHALPSGNSGDEQLNPVTTCVINDVESPRLARVSNRHHLGAERDKTTEWSLVAIKISSCFNKRVINNYWIDLVQDRDRWRALMNAAMNLLVP
jgi:hypothetical protein